MKGISTILAMILIVIIVVALIGLTYTFAVGLFSTTTGGATEQTETTTDRMLKSVSISALRCDSTGDTVYFTIRNTGSKAIVASELKAFIADTPLTVGFPVNLAAGETSSQLTGTGVALNAQEYTFVISAPAADVPKSVTCTA